MQGLTPNPIIPEVYDTTIRHEINFEMENLVIKGDLSGIVPWYRGLLNCRQSIHKENSFYVIPICTIYLESVKSTPQSILSGSVLKSSYYLRLGFFS